MEDENSIKKELYDIFALDFGRREGWPCYITHSLSRFYSAYMELALMVLQLDGGEVAQVVHSNRSAPNRPSPVPRARFRFRVSLLVGILILESVALLALRASKGSERSTDGAGVPARGSQAEAAKEASGPAMSGRAQGIAVDQSGNVYLADTSGNRILRIDASGRTKDIAGTGERGYSGDGGPAVSAELSSPRGVAVDSSGTVYIADSRNNVVRKVDAAGIITTIAGNGGKGDEGDGGPAMSASLSAPTSLAIDGEGDLIVFDSGNGRLRVVAADETIATVAVVPGDSSIGEPTSP